MAPLNKLGTETSQSPAYASDPADLLTPSQLADRLQVPKSWVFEQTRTRAKIRNSDPLPCVRMGRYLRFSWRQVSEWLSQKNS
jgi:hypothetical protein